jgi:hypothetical protein
MKTTAAKERAERKAKLDEAIGQAIEDIVACHGQALADFGRFSRVISGSAEITTKTTVLAGPLKGRRLDFTITIDPID